MLVAPVSGSFAIVKDHPYSHEVGSSSPNTNALRLYTSRVTAIHSEDRHTPARRNG